MDEVIHFGVELAFWCAGAVLILVLSFRLIRPEKLTRYLSKPWFRPSEYFYRDNGVLYASCKVSILVGAVGLSVAALVAWSV